MAIIRIPRSDDTSTFVLLNLEPTSDHSLTARVVGTDGAAAFILHLSPALATRALAPKSSCNAEEWTSILKAVLLEGLTPEDIEVTATVEDDANIQVVLRKTFEGGLKQRLGSLTLKYDEDEAIELLDWCAALATHAAEQAANLKREKEMVRKLVKETEELVKAKEEAEKELIGKCMRLVNTKKERSQQLQDRLSHYEKSGSPIREPMDVVERTEEEQPQTGKRKAAPKKKAPPKKAPAKATLPRRGKRAVPEPEPEEEEEDEQPEEVDEKVDDVDLDEGDVETEGETEGEDTPSDHSAEEKAPEVRTRAVSQSQDRSQKKAVTDDTEHEAPHVTTRAASQSQSHKKAPAQGDGSETESDDEL